MPSLYDKYVPRLHQQAVGHRQPTQKTRIYCGPEGWLTTEEFVARTEAAISAYARAQPLKFFHAILADGLRLKRHRL